MVYGISSASFYPNLTEVTVRQLGEQGVPNIEVFVNTFSELSHPYLKGLGETARNTGTKIVSLHPFTCAFEPFMLFTHYERRFQDALDWHRRYFEGMNLLGAEYFVFHGDKWRGSPENSVCSDEEYFERFGLLRDLGKEYGVIVAQENVERCRSRDLDFLQNMISYLDGDVALVFDNKQALRSGIGWEDYLRAVGDHVAHVHISDSGPAGDCLPLGKGTENLPEMLSALERHGFNGAVIVELYGEYMNSTEPVYESLSYLRGLERRNS